MGDFKSKLPDLKELGSMTGKLFQDVKKSVGDIIKDYKEKRAEDTPTEASSEAPKPKQRTKAEKPGDTEAKPEQPNTSEKKES